MNRREIKEHYNNLLQERDKKEQKYYKILNYKKSFKKFLKNQYKELLNIYFMGKHAQKIYDKTLKDFNEYYLFNKNEIDNLLKLEPEFKAIRKLEKLIKQQKDISETASKSVRKTKYVTRYSPPILAGKGIISGIQKRVPETYYETVPDEQAREKARIKMEELTLELKENNYYKTYQQKYWILAIFLKSKKRITNLDNILFDFTVLDQKVDKYVEEYNHITDYDKKLNAIKEKVSEIEKNILDTQKLLPILYRRKVEKQFKPISFENKETLSITKEKVLRDLQYMYEINKESIKIKESNNEIKSSMEF